MKAKELTQEQRIAIIRHAHQASLTIAPSKSVVEFIEEMNCESIAPDHVVEAQRADLEDESQFLFTDSAESIDEEEESLGLSDEMKGVYENKN